MTGSAAMTTFLPDGWRRMKLKYVANLRSGSGITSELISEEGPYAVYGGNGIRGFTTAFTHEGRHVLIGRQGALCGNINYADGRFWASEHAVVAHIIGPHDTTWLGELLRSMNLNQYSQSAAQPGLAAEFIANLEIPVPPLQAQRAIAGYLDAETARIDELIAAKENLLAILAEKRRAIISHAVTRGLDPTAQTRDSGIPWLGDIPAHWEVMRLKFLLRGMEQGWSPECHNSPAGPQDWGVLKAGCCNGGIFRPEENKMLPADLTPPPALEVNAGDVLMSRASGSPALIGSAARVPHDVRRQLLLSDKMYRLRPNTERIDPDFLVWVLGSFVGRHQVVGAISGAAGLANNISQSSVREFVFPTPPLEEQRQLVMHLRASNSAIGGLEQATERSLLLLRERRDAVIAAAVTGQLDVEAA